MAVGKLTGMRKKTQVQICANQCIIINITCFLNRTLYFNQVCDEKKNNQLWPKYISTNS
jgi:hypothetical protein